MNSLMDYFNVKTCDIWEGDVTKGERLKLIALPHLLVQVISRGLLLARATLKVGLASESHWM